MDKNDIKRLIGELTLEEKAGLTSGEDQWMTKAVERLGIGHARTSDGPHGIRALDYTDPKANVTMPAVCFPTAVTTASSFDRDMLFEMGEELGSECHAYGVDVLLGPGVNMKRSPLCGRNFEYFSEDPLLAGELGAAFVNGVQSKGVGTSLKHYFANSQETRRFTSSSEMDERTMREIYLPAFETVVKKAQPWTVMAAYNKIGGTHATANKTALDEILRKEWGFEGLVVSDWGATHDRVGAILAGTDLTMPAEDTDMQIVEAVKNGTLPEEALDKCCERVLELVFKAEEGRKVSAEFDPEKAHEKARKYAANSMVLLKNDGDFLPLDKSEPIAFIGAFADVPRFQGGGSSHIIPTKITGALKAASEKGCKISYAPAYDPATGKTDTKLFTEALDLAKKSEKTVLFIGLPDSMEYEGGDRPHMKLPEDMNRLVEAVCTICPDTAVVLHNGSPVEIPWADKPKAILEAYLAGQASGGAAADIIFGDVNPSGRLAESFPKKLEDNPSYLYYIGEDDRVTYNEGLFIGYRYYESKAMEVLYPFGHGLSYTSFEYSGMDLDRWRPLDPETETVTVTVNVINTGKRAGYEVVQLYVHPDHVKMIRPKRELKAFKKIYLEPGETKNVSFTLGKRAFACWDPVSHGWTVEKGRFGIEICRNAHDVIARRDLWTR